MYNYIKGVITLQENNYIVLENSGIGFEIYVANPYSYNLKYDYTVYIYNHIREDENTLYGFKSKEEKELFLKLINVKGLGPKMALPILATGNICDVETAIEQENVTYLTKFPKIGQKLARQIILDLKGKLANNQNITQDSFEELNSVLLSLGYKSPDIKKILPKIDRTMAIEKQVKEALKLMLK